MKQSRFWLFIITVAMLTAACSSGPSKEQSAKAGRMIETAHKARDFNRLLTLADSLEKEGCLTQAEAYYWKGYASDRMKKNRMAEFYWKTALEAASNSSDKGDLDTYAKTASRLANLLNSPACRSAVRGTAMRHHERLHEPAHLYRMLSGRNRQQRQ